MGCQFYLKQNRQLCSVPANHPRIGAIAPFSDRRFNVSHGRIHVLLQIYGQGTSIFLPRMATSSSMVTEPVDMVAEDASASESDEDDSRLEMGTSEGVVSDASTVLT